MPQDAYHPALNGAAPMAWLGESDLTRLTANAASARSRAEPRSDTKGWARVKPYGP